MYIYTHTCILNQVSLTVSTWDPKSLHQVDPGFQFKKKTKHLNSQGNSHDLLMRCDVICNHKDVI